MKIVIVGSGRVGFTLAENLTREMHDVAVIDIDEHALNRISDMLDVLAIKGNGANIGVLKSAGVESTDVLIAVTERDELNMVACLTAKKLGARHTIARIRDPEYAKELNLLKNELDIDMVINPEYSTASQILRLLRFPNATGIETFNRSRIELVGFRAVEGDIITDKPLREVQKQLGKIPILFCALERNGSTSIPNGDTVINAGDTVYVIGAITGISQFFKQLGRISQKIKNVFIIGGGLTAVYLARLLKDLKMGVKVVEADRKRCHELCALVPDALVINGDGTEHEVLTSENFSEYDAFVAVTGDDEDNLITSLFAKQTGIRRVIARINRPDYYDVVQSLNIDCLVNPKLITAYAIHKFIRGLQASEESPMEALHQIANGGAEAMEFHVTDSMRHLGIPLRDLNLKKGILIVSIVRNDDIIIPEGSSFILAGDNIIIIASGMSINEINDIYDE